MFSENITHNLTFVLKASTLAGKMGKEIPEWLKHAISARNNQHNKTKSPREANPASTDNVDKIIRQGEFLQVVWAKLEIDTVLQDLTTYFGGEVKNILLMGDFSNMPLEKNKSLSGVVKEHKSWLPDGVNEKSVGLYNSIVSTITKTMRVSGADVTESYTTQYQEDFFRFSILVRADKIFVNTAKTADYLLGITNDITDCDDLRRRINVFLNLDLKAPEPPTFTPSPF